MKNRSYPTFSATSRLSMAAALASCAIFTAGCSNMATTASDVNTFGSAGGMVQGSVHGGNQPVSGATVTLYSVSQSGHGASGVTLATTTTNSGGGFQFAQTATPSGGPVAPTALGGNTYECGTGADPLLYVTAKGGNTTGSGTSTNSAAAFIAPVGYCSVAAAQQVNMTEVTTAAMVAATGQFMNPATEEIGADGIGVAYVAIGHAFATVATLVNQQTGLAVTSSTKGAGTTVQSGGPFYVSGVTVTATPESAKLNTIANILSACVNQATSAGGNCSTLFADAVPPVASHTSQPNATFNTATDTIQAALYMFLNPTDGSTANRTALYNLSPAAAPFQPTLTSVPTDWTVGVAYTSNNTCDNVSSNSSFFSGPSSLAVDASGNVWFSNLQSNYGALSALTSTGAPYACLTLGTAFTTSYRSSTGIDDVGNIWYGNTGVTGLIRFTPNTGALLNFNTSNAAAPIALAADGSDAIFFSGVPSGGTGHLYRIDRAATSTTAGSPVVVSNLVGNTPTSIFPDKVGDIFVSSGSGYITEVNNSSTGSNLLNGYNSTTISVTAPALNVVVDQNNAVYVASGDAADTVTVLVPGTSGFSVRSSFPTAANTAGVITPLGLYIDGAMNSWLSDGAKEGTSGNYALSVIANDASAISATGSGLQKSATYLNTPHNLVIDLSGNVWIANDGNTNGLTELVGAAAPIYQPVAIGIQNNRFQTVP